MGNKRSKPGKAGSKLWGSFGSNVISHDLNVYQDAINLDKKTLKSLQMWWWTMSKSWLLQLLNQGLLVATTS